MSSCRALMGLCLLLASVHAAAAGNGKRIPPELTEAWEPEPAVVTPAEPGAAPSDALLLFDGGGLGHWQAARGGDAAWQVTDGVLTVAPGSGDIRKAYPP